MQLARIAAHFFSSMDRPHGHLGGLDALRFASVYCILLSHLGFREFGGFGVPILMALSGFLITRQLLSEFDRKNSISPRNFLISRALRIAPAYLVFVGVTLLADTLTGNEWPPGLIWYALTHTVNYYNATHGHPDISMAHVWTLSILEQFYLIWPLAFSMFISSSKRLYIMVAMILIALCWRIFAYTTVFADNVSWIYNALDCRLDSILFGCATATWLHHRPRDPKPSPNAAAMILIAVASLTFIAFSNDLKPWHYSFGYLFEAAAAMALIMSISRLSSHRRFGWLDSGAFSWLGKISYPLFLYHILAIGVARKLADEQMIQLVLASAIAIVTAGASYYAVERHALRFRHALRHRWAGA